MRKIVYYVAISLDGYIAAEDEDISGFVHQGDGVKRYLMDLQAFDTVIMGRKTYEFGYKFGLKAGQLAYPHMKHYIFSNNLSFEEADEDMHVCSLDIERIKELKQQKGTDIYLCGGGVFAAWLLEHEQIDLLKIKLNPLILGSGIRLFADLRKSYQLEWVKTKSYEEGLQIITYEIKY